MRTIAVEQTAEADRGRHPGFPSFNVMQAAPAAYLAERSTELSSAGLRPEADDATLW